MKAIGLAKIVEEKAHLKQLILKANELEE
jgi:hypothetical protein